MGYLDEAFDALRMTYEAITHIAPHSPGKYGEDAALSAEYDLFAGLDHLDREELVVHLVAHGNQLAAFPVPYTEVAVATGA